MLCGCFSFIRRLAKANFCGYEKEFDRLEQENERLVDPYRGVLNDIREEVDALDALLYDTKKGLRPKKRTVGKVAQEYRIKYGWSQDDLAWEAEISRVQIGRIKRNECDPTIATLKSWKRRYIFPK